VNAAVMTTTTARLLMMAPCFETRGRTYTGEENELGRSPRRRPCEDYRAACVEHTIPLSFSC
jgi:hypothetical protein